MTTQEAIHIMSEEAVRWRRLAHDLAEDPLDQDGRALEHTKQYNQKAEAAGVLIHLARMFVAQEMEQKLKGAGDGRKHIRNTLRDPGEGAGADAHKRQQIEAGGGIQKPEL